MGKADEPTLHNSHQVKRSAKSYNEKVNQCTDIYMKCATDLSHHLFLNIWFNGKWVQWFIETCANAHGNTAFRAKTGLYNFSKLEYQYVV